MPPAPRLTKPVPVPCAQLIELGNVFVVGSNAQNDASPGRAPPPDTTSRRLLGATQPCPYMQMRAR